jgi:hypothetical protein
MQATRASVQRGASRRALHSRHEPMTVCRPESGASAIAAAVSRRGEVAPVGHEEGRDLRRDRDDPRFHTSVSQGA